MSISSILSNNLVGQASSTTNSQRHKDFQQLVSALESGDLSAAQKAFAQFQSDLGSGSTSGAPANATASPDNSPFKNLISQIGSALQSGNISAAQKALTDFRNQAPSRTSGTSGGPGAFLDAIFQALSQAGVSGTSVTNATTATSPSTPATSAQNPLQALGAFMHDLFSALQAQAGQAASGGAVQGEGDSDGDNDGSVSSGVAGTSGGHHRQNSGLAQIESSLQNLIQQLSSSASGSTTSGATASGSAAASSASPSSELQQSYQNLLSALGVSGSESTLGSFLQALAQNLHGISNSGNVVNTLA